MSFRAVSELRFIPKGQTIKAEYYINEILNRSLMSSLHRQPEQGSILTRKLFSVCRRPLIDISQPYISDGRIEVIIDREYQCMRILGESVALVTVLPKIRHTFYRYPLME